MARDADRLFDKLVEDMCNLAPGDDFLDSCMALDAGAMKRVPLRYRIIALGFARGLSLEEVNAQLARQRCPRLYSRSFWEATLIFAFKNGYSYDRWKALRAQCQDLYADLGASPWFPEKKITYAELERYVRENSDGQGDAMATERRTGQLQSALLRVDDSVDALRAFLAANLESFSTVREKTRYYFCKYLYYWLNRRVERYFDACRRGRGVDEALSELLCLKVVTALRRNQTLPEARKRELIREAPISCGEIFDAFNYFYFGYVSVDWVETLMECYDRVEDIPAAHKASLAEVFRRGRPQWRHSSDDEVIALRLAELEQSEDAAFARTGSRGYGRGREGENALYKFIRGAQDIDRTPLICFLLFFASDGAMPEAHRLTVARLGDILLQCGYAAPDVEDDFDWFAVEFLESRRPMDFLTEVMLGYARQHENSFLYHVYGHGVLNEEELARVMLGR